MEATIKPRVGKFAPKQIRQSDGTVVTVIPAGGDIGRAAFSGTHTRATTLNVAPRRIRGMLPAAFCREAESEVAALAS